MASQARRNKIKVDDFKFALRHDPRKLGRVEELLVMSKVIADARKQFDDKPEAEK
jgi:transcription initiation factor TFIID subunit 13